MYRILDSYLCSDEQIYEKSLLFYLKYSELPCFNFVENCKKPTAIIISINTVCDVPQEHLDLIKKFALQNTENKIVIDVSIEEFVKFPFFNLINFLNEIGVQDSQISVFAGGYNLDAWKKENNIDLHVIGLQGLEPAYHAFVSGRMHIKAPESENFYRKIEPRKLKKHFLTYIKNPRSYRKLYHIFMIENNIYEKSHYSWHAIKPIKKHDLKYAKKLNIISDSIVKDEYNIPEIPLECPIDGPGEWDSYGHHLDCGICLTHDLHVFYENLELLYTETDCKRIYFTEKTFKPMVAGMPFLTLGLPFNKTIHEEYGYRSFNEVLGGVGDTKDYKTCILNDLKMLKDLSNLSLSQLEEKLNTNEILDLCKHNQEHFRTKPELVKLEKEFFKIFDK
jgi:hypothetical protein